MSGLDLQPAQRLSAYVSRAGVWSVRSAGRRPMFRDECPTRVVSRFVAEPEACRRLAAGVRTSTPIAPIAWRATGPALRPVLLDRPPARRVGRDSVLGAVELSVRQVLEAVAELQEASLQLVCWELNVQEDEARPAFERAIADGLLARSGVDDLYDEVMYALTDAGRRALEGAR